MHLAKRDLIANIKFHNRLLLKEFLIILKEQGKVNKKPMELHKESGTGM